MKNVLGVWVLSLSMVGIVHGQDRNSRSPLASPNPEILIAQVDDSDLRDEETLQELMQIEYDKDAWSMGAAVGASLLPGAGWGLCMLTNRFKASCPLFCRWLDMALVSPI